MGSVRVGVCSFGGRTSVCGVEYPISSVLQGHIVVHAKVVVGVRVGVCSLEIVGV